MSGNLLQIGQSGAMAARAALELTGQNIANAGNADYARRSLSLADLTPTGSVAYTQGFTSGSGVRIDRVARADSVLLYAQARQSGSDLARATTELAGLREAEQSVEQAGIYPALVEFEAALGALRSDPLSPSLRAAVVERGRVLADSVRLGDSGLAGAMERGRFEASAGVAALNTDAGELARLNDALLRSRDGTSGQAALLDRRDALLARMAQATGITVEYGQRGMVDVRLGDGTGPYLVSGTAATALASVEQADGTIGFSLGGSPVALTGGSLAGAGQALAAQRDARAGLDAMALNLLTSVNTAQSAGVTPAGTSGLPFFAGTGARDLAVVLPDGDGLATAPAGSGPQSRSTANLDALRAALAGPGGPTAQADALLTGLSQAVAGRGVTRDVLATVAESAARALRAETAVDLDAEAADLLRFQQAFQASGRVIQAAAEIFDTILGIR
ncbi:MAG: flagellar hook-associated protein FlgK [Sphingomonadaceae bacterium]|nr:flagellar hook-associated protein FlgK [Sphingomonadaceae bacterium]